MSLKKDAISIVRINESNYLEFSKLLEWRRTGIEQDDFSGYQGEKLEKFFDEYEILSSKTFFMLGAKIGEKFVGNINAVLIPKPDPRLGILYVDELWTAPNYRKQGIAEELMKEVFKLGKELNMWKVRLYVGKDNKVARGFYKKMGFLENDESLFCEAPVR